MLQPKAHNSDHLDATGAWLHSNIPFAPGLLVLLLLLGFPTAGQAQFTYTTNNGTITITGYYGPGGAVTIPSTITGLPVTTIGYYAFDLSDATSISIPSSVTTIEFSAFNYCTSLASITIPNGVISIGANAFRACYSLTNAIIPASVTSIGNRPFDLCPSLKTINVDAQNAFYSSVNGVFFDKNQTTLIQFPPAKIGSYTIPISVVRIGAGSFSYCANLTAVTIPSGVTNIGSDAFLSCTSLTNILLPASVARIESSAFFHCTNLTSITIPGTVSFIGSRAFEDCFSLMDITIPSNTTFVADYAFRYCTSLTNWPCLDLVDSVGVTHEACFS